MGWTGVYMDMKSTKTMILKDMNFSGATCTSKVIGHANGRGGLWILREISHINKDPHPNHVYVTATFVKIERKKGETFYKEIDIDCHPYYYDCPSSWLNRIQTQYDMGKEWLEKAKKIADAMKIEIKHGQTFRHNSVDWTVEYKYSSQKWACRTSQGKLYVVRNADIREALSKVEPTV